LLILGVVCLFFFFFLLFSFPVVVLSLYVSFGVCLSFLVTDPDVCDFFVVLLYCLVFVCPVRGLLLTCFRDVSLLILLYSSVDLFY